LAWLVWTSWCAKHDCGKFSSSSEILKNARPYVNRISDLLTLEGHKICIQKTTHSSSPQSSIAPYLSAELLPDFGYYFDISPKHMDRMDLGKSKADDS